MRYALFVGIVFIVACGGGSTTTGPSPIASSFLVGSWTGNVTIVRQGLAPTTSPTRWTFTEMPQTASHSFSTNITVNDAWLNVSTTVNSVLVGSQFEMDGSFNSPRGCKGTIASLGTAQPGRIDATFHGWDCGESATFDGSVILTR